MNKKKSNGLAANAALIRTASELGISIKRAEAYSKIIYDTFKIQGMDSYDRLLEIIQDENNIDMLIDAFKGRKDWDEAIQFIKVYIAGMGSYETKEEEKQEDIVELIDILMEVEEEIEWGSIEELENETGSEIKDSIVLNIIDCEIKSQSLEDLQTLKYIEIPEESYDDLRDDFKFAEHLDILNEIYDKGDDKSSIMFVCESKETGLLACKYISAILAPADDAEEDEISFEGKLPLVSAVEIDNYIKLKNINTTPFFNSGFGVQAVQSMNNNILPWWVKYNEVPLIVLIERNSFLSEEFLDKLKTLEETHYGIFIVAEDEKEQEKVDEGLFAFGSNIHQLIEDISFKLDYDTYKIDTPSVESDYMKKVLKEAALSRGYKVGEEVDIEEVLKKLKKYRAKSWEGNSTVIQLVKKAIKLKKRDFGVLNQEDFAFIGRGLIASSRMEDKTKQDEQRMDAVERMNKYIFGLEHVKETMLEAVNILMLNAEREKKGLRPGKVNNVFAFYGPPGVGKTEMATHFADILFEKNLLPGNKFLNTTGASLKGAYVGHTVPKIQNAFSEHDILFIDECYSLTASDHGMDTFSQEALAELCVQLEKHGKDKLIIFAGYGGDVLEKNNKMKGFLESNPGISSRVSFHVNFPSYSPGKEMPEIFQRIVLNSDYILESGWREAVIDFFKERAKSESFGNGREARKLFQHCIAVQSSRLADKINDVDALKLITLEDVKTAASRILEAEKNINIKEINRIGF